MDKLCSKYPSPIRVWMGPNLYVYVDDPQSAETLLKHRNAFEKPNVYDAVKDVLGADGLFTLKGNRYQLYYVYLKFIIIVIIKEALVNR